MENLSVKQATILAEVYKSVRITVGSPMESALVLSTVVAQVGCQLANTNLSVESDDTRTITTSAGSFEPTVGINNTVTLRGAIRIGLYANARNPLGIVSTSKFGKEFPDYELVSSELIRLPLDAIGFENTQAPYKNLPFF